MCIRDRGSYILAFEEEAGSVKDVEITEVDIDNFIRAKGAIFSAIRTMPVSYTHLIDGAVPYEAPCYGHLADAVIRELGVPLVTGDIPGVAVILGSAPVSYTHLCYNADRCRYYANP